MREKLRSTDPRQVGKYGLIARLGSGGMGDVFLGQSPGGRLVAVKLIRSDLAQNPDFRVRFAREVAAARRVSGIFTAPVVDAEPDGEQPWLVTAYVPGPSLAETVASQGPLAPESVIRLAAGLAEGVAAIHAAGVIHRDLKPLNVLLSPDGPRIIDFGISRAFDTAGLTATGSIVGSPGFMSPEQAEGRPIGPPSDIFSLGSVLTFAASGDGPFGSDQPAILIYRIVHTTPNVGGVPPAIRPLVERCLAKDPAQRPTAEAVLAELPAPPRPGLIAGEPTISSPGDFATTEPWAGPSDNYEPPRPARQATEQAVNGSNRRPASSMRTTRPSRLALGSAAAVLVLAAGLFAARQFHTTTNAPPAKEQTSSTRSPQSVVRAYIAALNRRDFRAAWNLGGDNLGQPYSSFVAGFAKTSRIVIASLHVTGATVTIRTLAYETTGPVQTYAFSYTVQGGTIITSRARLLSTSP